MVGFHNFIEDGDDKFSLNSDENQQLSESTERLESIYKMNLYS